MVLFLNSFAKTLQLDLLAEKGRHEKGSILPANQNYNSLNWATDYTD